MNKFSEKALQSLTGYYVYALIDPRNDHVFYIGKGTGNRVFNHEIESDRDPETEKKKLLTIQAIEGEGLHVKRVMINWGLSEEEAFAAEASLINLLNFINGNLLTNIVAGHHVHNCLTVEDFELEYGAENLKETEIKHNILVIKINKRYRSDMSEKDLYEAVRGVWKASMRSIKERKIEYVFGVYNQLIVAVYKPDEWHFVHERIDLPRPEELLGSDIERIKDRVYFISRDYKKMDDNQKVYLHKSIKELKVNKSAQNPISYLIPEKNRTKEIHAFSLKWYNRFLSSEANYEEFIEPEMGEECRELEFEMDCGNAFMDIYGEAIHNASELESIIGQVSDVFLLGSAVFSRWRYFNHWAYQGSEILMPENKKWFLIALKKLASLTEGR